MAQPLRILHVDDDPDFADLTADFLTREAEHFEVVTETDPRDALSRLEDGAFDCVVSEYQLPRMNGLDVLDAVRESRPDLPFILFTNQGSEQVAADAIEKGVTSYLRKETGGTVQYTTLANRIRNHVEQYRAEREARTRKQEHELVPKTATAVFWTFDPAESVSFSEGLHHFGYEPEGTPAERDVDWFFDRVHPDERERLRRLTDPVLAREADVVDELTPERGQFSMGLRFQRSGGTHADCQVRGIILFDGDDIIGVIGIMEDISDRKAPERTLERERDRRAALFENTPDPIMEVHFEGGTPIIDSVNPAFEDIFGVTAEAATDQRVADVVVPDSERDEHERLRERVLHGDPVETAVRRETATGIREFMLRIIPFDVNDASSGAYAWYTDITERKERERELERNERIIHEMNDGVVVVQDGIITFTNPPVSELVGYPVEEINGAHLSEFIAPADRDLVQRRYRERVEGNDPPSPYEIEVLSKDGETIPVELTAARVEYDGRPATVSIVRDITERKERERELEAAKRRFDAVFNNPIAFMALLDRDGTVVEINDAALEFVERSSDDVVGEPFPETPWWAHSEDLKKSLRSWIDRAAAGEVVRFEADHYNPDGERVTIDGVLHPITDEAGAVTSVLAAGRDISERKEHERELERKNERLDEFASVISHDLRNPLNVAEGRLELLEEECESEHLAAVERAHDRMQQMIDDLLALARQGETPSELAAVDLADVAEDGWRNVETDAATLVTETDRTILADPGRLTQLFENLIRNSVEHGSTSDRTQSDNSVEHGSTGNRTESGDSVEHGDADVTVTVGDLADGFYVEDDGPGIDPDERDRVFESGYSTSRDGTGFGLSIVEEITDAHDWTISVTEGTDSGARFELTGVEFGDR